MKYADVLEVIISLTAQVSIYKSLSNDYSTSNMRGKTTQITYDMIRGLESRRCPNRQSSVDSEWISYGVDK